MSEIITRRPPGPEGWIGQIEPLRVAHLTDLHVGRMTPLELQLEATKLVKDARPDLVVITGDFVCHSQVYLQDLEEVVRSLDLPVFAVLGNHDHWAGGAAVVRSLKRAGAEVLDNQWTHQTFRGQTLQLVGLNDAYTGHADRERALQGIDTRIPTLGLSHIAEEADGLFERGIPLVLSGHTHGGQFYAGKLSDWVFSRVLGHKYLHGLYGSRQRGLVYVSAGIGAAVVPFRIGARATPELALFDLGAPKDAVEDAHIEQAPLPGRPPSEKTVERRRQAVHKKRERRARRGLSD